VDHLLVVSDPTQRGIVAAERIAALRNELDINVENAYLILNRAPAEIPAPLQERIAALDIPLLGVIPADAEITDFDFSGRPLVELEENSPVYRAIAEMMTEIIL
jgi:CO dehydrogenase maturation factor